MDPRVVVLDTETTGLGHRKGREDGIVQVGLATRNPNDGEVETWSAVCNPGKRYLQGGRADEALAINGLTKEQILASPPAEQAARDLSQRLDGLRQAVGGIELRCFNLTFDRPFLEADPWSIDGPWGRCLMKLAERRLGFWKWPKLEEAIRALDLSFPDGGAHDAAADAHAALLVYEQLVERERGAP